METLIKKIVPCAVAGQRAELTALLRGTAVCVNGCQLFRNGAEALLRRGTVVACGDGERTEDKLLAVRRAVESRGVAKGARTNKKNKA